MRKKIWIILIALCVFGYKGIKAQNNYEVNFFIHENQDSMIYIEGYSGEKTIIMDSVLRDKKDEGFHWKAKDYPMGMYMVRDSLQGMFSFVLEKSNNFTIEVYPSGEYFVKGSPENDAYFLYQKENKKYQLAMYYYKLDVQKEPSKKDSLYNELQKKMDTFNVFQKQFFVLYPNNLITSVSQSMVQKTPSNFIENNKVKKGMEMEYAIYYRKHYWDTFHFNDSRILYSPYFMKKFRTYISEITMQNPDTINEAIDEFIDAAKRGGGQMYADYIVAYYLDHSPKLPFSFNEITYVHIVDKYVNNKSTYLLPTEIQYHKNNVNKLRPFLPGNIMPNIVTRDFNGQEHSLYKVKNKYTVLYFFSSTCESCKKNLDVLEDFYKNKSKDMDVEVFCIDLEEDEAVCKARQEAHPFPWIVTHSTPKALEQYGFNLDHTPEIYILDATKRIINKTAIYAHVEETITNEEKLKQKQQQQ